MINGKLFARFPLVLTLLIISVSYGCRWQAIESTSTVPDPTVLPSSTWTKIPSSPTGDMLIITATVMTTSYPSPSLPALTPTWTPLPTLPPEKAQELISELMETNNGCRLPCWWGITPGETSWQEAHHFFAPFASEIHKGKTKEQGYGVLYGLEGNPLGGGAGFWTDEKGVIQKILVGPASTKRRFELDSLLQDYGKPSDVYIVTYSNAPFNYIPFSLAVGYRQQRILAVFELEAQPEGDYIVACPQTTAPKLILWSNKEDLTKKRVQEELGNNQNVRNLERVSDLSIEEFYQIFKNRENKTCIETPVEIW
jgi:hypothetical protein